MWQRLHEQDPPGGRVVAVAVDAQGAPAVLPWLDAAHVSFPCLVDARAAVPARLGTTVVRTFVALDPHGRAVRPPVKVHAEDPATYAAIGDWLAGGSVESLAGLEEAGVPVGSGSDERAKAECRAWLELATVALEEQRAEDAATALQRARAADPDNALVMRQLWAVTHPERFYDGPIDKEWQQRQLGGD